MNRFLWIARHEYARHIRRKGFLLATFGLPLLLIAGLGLVVFLILSEAPERAIGYIDHSGILVKGISLAGQNGGGQAYVPLIALGDEAEARQKIASGQIDAYAVIPVSYRSSGNITIYSRQNLSRMGELTLEDFVRHSLVAEQPAQIAVRAITPISELRHQIIGSGRETGSENGLLFFIPILFGLLFMVALFFSSGTLLQAMIEEKENRTMEIVMTSIAPWQLVGGKTLGLGLLGLTQIMLWMAGGAALWLIGAAQLNELRQLSLPGHTALVALLFFIPGFLLYAGCMVGIGAMVTSNQESQQLASIVSLLAISPLMMSYLFMTDPNGVVPLAMSFFPLSAPMAMIMRLPMTDIPLWQIAISLLTVVLSAALANWAAARLFRAGMLRYGQRIRLGEIFGIIAQRQRG